MATANRFQVVGVNDERDYCECCGKKGLKRVVWIRDIETDEVRHFGTTCANAPAKGFDLADEIKRAAAQFASLEQTRTYYATQQYRREGGKYMKKDATSWTPADPALYARIRGEWATRSNFNY